MSCPRHVAPIALLLAFGPLALGCGPTVELEDGGGSGTAGDSDESGDSGPGGSDGGGVILSVDREVDILFVVDNSASMGEEQATLAANFASFVQVLEHPTVAADYRIGVTTTDNGNPWCSGTGPEAGQLRAVSCRLRPAEFVFEGAQTIDVFQEACLDVCPEQWTSISIQPTTVAGDPEARPRPWLERIAGQMNLPEGLSMAEAFQCIGPQGIDGCGFESPLESMWKALRRTATETETSYGFIRERSVLAIVHLTDEADCSYNDDWESIFLPEGDRVFWSDPTAPAPTSAVCWNAGVACLGSGTYDDCVSVDLDTLGNEVSATEASSQAVLRPMSRYIELVQEIENDKLALRPDQEVLIAVIGGVGADGSVTYQDATDPGFQDDFGIGPGCTSSAGQAVPPVRLRELAEAFRVGTQRNLFSICDADYGPALEATAQAVADQIQPTCMVACVADTDPTTPEVDPQCTLTEFAPAPDGGMLETDVPMCNGETVPTGADLCYQPLVGDAMSNYCSDIGYNLEFRVLRRVGEPAASGSYVEAICQLSQMKNIDCPELP